VPVLNWDTKAPVDWTGSYLEQFMPPTRGVTQVAAALKKPITVPESQASTTGTSSSPKTTSAERRTPEKDKLPMGKRKPPKIRTTPEKDKDANQSKKHENNNARKRQNRNGRDSDENEDSNPPGDKSDSDENGSGNPPGDKSDSDENDSGSLARKHQRNAKAQDKGDFHSGNDSEDADMKARPPQKKGRGMQLDEEDQDDESDTHRSPSSAKKPRTKKQNYPQSSAKQTMPTKKKTELELRVFHKL
jgi:hypothetical protein